MLTASFIGTELSRYRDYDARKALEELFTVGDCEGYTSEEILEYLQELSDEISQMDPEDFDEANQQSLPFAIDGKHFRVLHSLEDSSPKIRRIF